MALVALTGASLATRAALRRQWIAEEETRARAHFVPARKKAFRAQTSGIIVTALTYIVLMAPLLLWSLGAIDQYTDAIGVALGGAAAVAVPIWIWEALNPALSD